MNRPECIAVNPKTSNLLEFVQDQTEEGVGVDTAIECGGVKHVERRTKSYGKASWFAGLHSGRRQSTR